MSLEDSLNRYSGLLLSSRYTATEASFRLKRVNDVDLTFTMLFSRDDFDTVRRMGHHVQEMENRVVGFVPKTYTIDDVDYDLVPDGNLFIQIGSIWYRWEQTFESDGSGFMLQFRTVEMDTASLTQNRRN